MADTTTRPVPQPASVPGVRAQSPGEFLASLPWWLFVLIAILIVIVFSIFIDPDYREAFNYIRGDVQSGLAITIVTSLVAYSIATLLGLIAGLGRISRSVIISNIATFYVETVRGIPMLVLIFSVAFVIVPAFVPMLNWIGNLLVSIGVRGFAVNLANLQNNEIPTLARAIVALALTYGAFLAEIFRAGIQSIGRGQMEAARSLGMTYAQAMWYIILPQAIRNILPALGNDFVSMVKDSSLISVLAIRDITQLARLYAGSTFRFPEAYTTLTVLYLTMTVGLSLVIRILERRLRRHV